MVDSNLIKALFTLLRSGLWNRDIDDMDCFPLSDKEWSVLLDIAISQTIEGLIYDGIQKLPTAYSPSRDFMLILVVRLNKIELQNKKMNNCIKEQVHFFEGLKVNPILLKGQGIGSLYPISAHRVCGDIDWYFDNVNDREAVESVLKAKNVRITRPTHDSCNYIWRYCEVEHHTKLFDVFSPLAKYKLERITKDFLSDKYILEREGYNLTLLPANLNLIQVNLHILKHLLSFGVGLRQFCDSAILYDKYDGIYDKKWLFDVYNDIGVIKWVYVLHDLLVQYLGLDERKLPFLSKKKVSSDWMVRDILETGNFGFYDEKYTVIEKDNKIKRRDKSKRLWYSFRKYYPLAPYEAISFPIVHFFDRFKSLTFG